MSCQRITSALLRRSLSARQQTALDPEAVYRANLDKRQR
jgi:hypothetical protein